MIHLMMYSTHFNLWLYSAEHLVNEDSDNEIRNLLLLFHGLLFH